MEAIFHVDSQWFTDAYRAFYETNDPVNLDQHYDMLFAGNAKRLHLDTCETVLSFGVGHGALDAYLVQRFMPKLKKYIGVEPNEVLLEEFRDKMQAVVEPKVEVETCHNLAEKYSGPEQGVDLILLMDVLYYVPEPKLFMDKCLQWLAPQGHLVIKHQDGGDTWSKFQNNPYSDDSYRSEKIMRDLEELGFKAVTYGTESHGARFPEDKHALEWITGEAPKELYDFLLSRDTTEGERAEMDVFMQQNNRDSANRRIICVPKSNDQLTSFKIR